LNSKALSVWIYEKRIALCVVALLFYAVCVAGVFFVKFESDFRLFFPEDSALIQTFDDISEKYEQGDSLVFYLKFNQDQTLDNGKMKIIQHADELSNQLPFVRSVRSLSSFQKSFSDNESCAQHLVEQRWPDGFI